jgi:hypothetical protein
MATTQTIVGIDQVKGPGPGANQLVRAIRFAVKVSGAYATATKPNFNVYTALAAMKQLLGATSFIVHKVILFRDFVKSDGTVYTVPNSTIALANVTSGATNDKATFAIYTGTGSVDGEAGSGAEIADGAIPDMTFEFIAFVTVPASQI